jgi:spermidine synthase
MIPWKLLDRAPVPGGKGELMLYQRGEEFSIRVTARGELMNSRVHGSEDALAQLACARLAGRARPRLLIGGLGMGFTLAAALRELGPDAEVVVAELVPAVVAWNRGPLGAPAGYPLLDTRASVQEIDVARLLRSERDAYDAILLDVDNGPEGLTRDANDWLYGSAGLAATFAALRADGILAVWSAGGDSDFTDRLRRTGFEAEEIRMRARKSKGAHHTIWLARRPGVSG